MGIAAYNRGSRAISNQIDIELHGRIHGAKPTKSKAHQDSNLPEGILRSTYCPDDYLAGTALFLEYRNGWYLVTTRWQILKRRRSLEAAAKIFEAVSMYGHYGLMRA